MDSITLAQMRFSMRCLTCNAQRWSLSLILAMGVGLFGVLLPLSGLAFGTDALRVQGKVVAVNLGVRPQVIVVRTVSSKKKTMLVGATVNLEVEIIKGHRRVGLKTIKVGEIVDLVYAKTLEGLVAQSIRVR